MNESAQQNIEGAIDDTQQIIEGEALTAERIYDVQICMAVMGNMWDEISEDDAPVYHPDVINEYWVGIYDDGLIGIYRIHPLNSICFQIHAFMMDRTKKESGKVILQWCVHNIEDMQKLIAEIPVIYQNVYYYTKKQGFKDEGINRKSFMKNDKLHDQYRLGITRSEIWSQL